MEQKSSPKGSFQEEILKLLKGNPGKGFTFNDIAKELGRSPGSTSGTLYVLYKAGSIIKNNQHPAKYFYNVEPNKNRSERKSSYKEDTQEIDEIVQKLRLELEELDKRREKLRLELEELDKRREKLKVIKVTLENLEKELRNINFVQS